MKAIIPAAGLGTRLLPVTKTIPKEMLPVVDKPAIQFIVEEAVDSGIDEILIITGKGKRAIENYFDRAFELESYLEKKGDLESLERIKKVNDLPKIHFIRQKKPNGLGDAILYAESFVNGEDFAVLLGDDIIDSKEPALKQLINFYEKNKGTYVAVEEKNDSSISNYGVVSGEKLEENFFKVLEIEEKPKQPKSNLAIIGRYILNSNIFNYLKKADLNLGELQLTDSLAKMNPLFAVKINGKRYDIGNKEGYLTANIEFGKKRGII